MIPSVLSPTLFLSLFLSLSLSLSLSRGNDPPPNNSPIPHDALFSPDEFAKGGLGVSFANISARFLVLARSISVRFSGIAGISDFVISRDAGP